ncbi:MAG: hypothetical protein OXE42_18140 [Gammaproteobacteria bacterium]|nr:hypothetical protein [Gammaproteobacteria bacterium]
MGIYEVMRRMPGINKEQAGQAEAGIGYLDWFQAIKHDIAGSAISMPPDYFL